MRLQVSLVPAPNIGPGWIIGLLLSDFIICKKGFIISASELWKRHQLNTCCVQNKLGSQQPWKSIVFPKNMRTACLTSIYITHLCQSMLRKLQKCQWNLHKHPMKKALLPTRFQRMTLGPNNINNELKSSDLMPPTQLHMLCS